jgi:uncharacterized Zn-binding protein involved in type VI secretion
MLATGRIGDQYLNRCNTPTQGSGSPNVFSNQIATSRIGDRTVPFREIVPCDECCRTFVGTVLDGSKKVFVNGVATERISSKALGITGNFPLLKGSVNVFVT